jgi:FAD/FMN-containing dehydrogenase
MSLAATLGLDAARGADPERYRIGGAAPRLALRPASRDELAEALRGATRDRLAVVPWGGGTSLGGDGAPPRYDLALDVTGLDRVVEYDPEDMTVTAECGITLEALGRTLAARGQELPIEGAHATQATLGGALAANAAGARRLEFGAPRDRILGARFALGDGTLARSGGRVVKNVAGYAIHRLLCGSRGGLATLVEASLKVAPAPERRVAWLYASGAARLADAERWRALDRVEPIVTTVLGGDAVRASGAALAAAALVAVVGFEADAPWVERQGEAARQALGEPDARLEGDGAAALWQRLADAGETSGAWATLTTADRRPDAVAPLLESGGTFVFHAPAGRLHLRVDAGDGAGAMAALVGRGFTTIASNAGANGGAAPRLATLTTLRARVRDAIDPDFRFALGARWVGHGEAF